MASKLKTSPKKPRPREVKTKRKRGSQQELNRTVTKALHNLFTRVEKLEKKDKRRLIGFGACAEGSEMDAPDLDELAESEIIG